MDLHTAIADGVRLVGGLIRMPNTDLVELAGLHGFDFVVVDCEHGAVDIGMMTSHIQVARGYGLPVIARIPGHERGNLGRALDAGAEGLLIPHVSDQQQALDVVKASSFPPDGERGFAAYTPAGGFGTLDVRDLVRFRPMIIAMIEDPDGVRNAGRIASTPGISGLMIGPADLAVASGAPGESGGTAVRAALSTTQRATHAAGKTSVHIVGSPAAAAQRFDDGADVVIYSVTAVLNEAFTAMRAAAGERAMPAYAR